MKISALMNVNLVKKVSKLALSILCVSILGLTLAQNTHAQDYILPDESDTYSSYPQTTNHKLQNVDSDVELNTHNGMQILLIETLSAISCQLTGIDPTSENKKCLGINSETGKIGFVEGNGLLGLSTNLLTITLAPPISSTQYLSYMKGNFNTVNTTYASDPDYFDPFDPNKDYLRCLDGGDEGRGVGFCSLMPVLNLWVTMRNIVYLILVLIFIIIGLGIMLRIHIDPRTVMTIQNQIPKIIIGIILITFSYAIAGFMVDLMWLTTYIFASVITVATAPSGEMFNHNLLLSMLQSGTPFEAANHIKYAGDGRIFQDGIFLSGPLNMADTIGSAFSSLIQSILTGGRGGNFLTDILGGVIHIIAFIVIAIAIIVALLRVWVALILALINVILDVVFAPFWLLAGILPGSSGISAWFRDLTANLALFPVVIAFMLFANYFVNAFSGNTDPSGTPDAYIMFPLLGGTNSGSIAALIGFGFLLMLPTLLGQIKQFFKAPNLNLGKMMDPVRVGMGGPGRLARGAKSYVGQSKYELTDTGTKEVSRKRRLGRAFGMLGS